MRRTALAVGVVVLLAAMGSGAYVQAELNRPIPSLVPSSSFPSTVSVEGQPPTIPWPTAGAAAVGVVGFDTIGSSGDGSPRPIASIGKVMTAHLILSDHPLTLGNQGPSVTVTADDVRTYLFDVADGQSTVPVVLGEELTEYQMLQALLLPSSNNIADMLARWDAGSLDAFVAKMNVKATELRMTSTHFADASGYLPQTVSTARDLALLGQAAMSNPVFAEIVGQHEATLPVADRVFNVNSVVGRDGIIGIKTGFTPEAGSCFMFAIRRQVGDQVMLLVGAVLDQTQLSDAFNQSTAIATAAASSVRTSRVLRQTQVIGSVIAPWGANADIVPSEDVDFLAWSGMAVETAVQLESVSIPAPAGTRAGTLTLRLANQQKTVELLTTAPMDGPGRYWRLTRPLREK